MTAKEHRDFAVSLLTHYLETLFDAANLTWGTANDHEVERIVDNLIAATRLEDQ